MKIKKSVITILGLTVFTYATSVYGLSLSSSAFTDGGSLPKKYSCNGDTPPLAINDVPAGTQSLVLIMDDPDAPSGTWLHWVLYDLPATTNIVENVSTKPVWEDGTKQGKNDWSDAKYGGTCPPDGEHRYFFKLYALDKKLDLKKRARLYKVKKAMKGHILAETKIMAKLRPYNVLA